MKIILERSHNILDNTTVYNLIKRDIDYFYKVYSTDSLDDAMAKFEILKNNPEHIEKSNILVWTYPEKEENSNVGLFDNDWHPDTEYFF